MKVLVYTLGCRLNQCESEAIADAFVREGFVVTDKITEAELFVMNTCTVTGKADQKGRRIIRQMAEIAPTLVTGCYAELSKESISALGDRVIVVPMECKSRLAELPAFLCAHRGIEPADSVRLFFETEGRIKGDPFAFAPKRLTFHSRAYLKVQDGCDNSCAFCRVHVARGKSVSLDADEVVRRAKDLEAAGYREICLTGVNLTMYARDKGGLGMLVEKLLENLSEKVRIRFSSMEADHIDDRLLATFADKRVAPHFHIPVQSASDKVLKRCNRHYDREGLEYVVRRMKELKDDPFIAADIIAGLPAEEEEDFETTINFLRDNGFARLHVFPFSPRPDTPLWKAKDRVPEYVRDERAAKLRVLSEELFSDYCLRQKGKTVEAVVECGGGGTTANYLKVAINDLPEDIRQGELIEVSIGKQLDQDSCEAVFLRKK